MHAYLITGNNESGINIEAEKIAKRNSAKILEFPLQKIEDVRSLGTFVALKLAEPTAILVKNIDSATTEALNAFLKNLEEPQENLYYILTARSANRVLPTIVSRCQIVKTNNYKEPAINKNEKTEKFLEMTTAEKILYLDGIKKREEAQTFVEELMVVSHEKIHGPVSDYQKSVREIAAEEETLAALKANGNVKIQLTNLAITLAN